MAVEAFAAIAFRQARSFRRHRLRSRWRGAHAESIDHSRRYFFQAAGVIAGAVPFVSAAYGFVAERFRFYVREVEIPIANLPPALDGLRITQLSDIHIGSYMPVAQVRRAVGMANELNGDLTVVTGDFLTGRTDPLEDCITELSRLRAPLGVWGCNGNHEIYARAEAKSAELFQKFGMKLLRQENAELRWQGSAFNLIGVDYQRQRDDDGNPAADAGRRGTARPARRPQYFAFAQSEFVSAKAAELGIELSLAGHTHGGQVRVEILDHRWSPAEFLTPYVAGLYKRPLFASVESGRQRNSQLSVQPPVSNLQPPASTSIAASARSAPRPPGRPSGNHTNHLAARGLSRTGFSLSGFRFSSSGRSTGKARTG